MLFYINIVGSTVFYAYLYHHTVVLDKYMHSNLVIVLQKIIVILIII